MIIATNQITLADVNDGVALYTWIRYADDANGTGLSSSPTNKKYIGIAYNKPTLTPSSTPSDYTWSLIKGEQGIAGDRGADGVTYYTWIKYADSPTTGMTDNPSGKTYVGIAHNKTTATESTNYGDYQWSLIKGADGRDGVDAIIANLTNDSHVLPANSSGVVSSYGGAETSMQVFIGTSDDTNNWSFTATPSTGVTGTLTGNKYTVTSLASANDTGYVDITASRTGYVSLTSRFTLTKSKQGVVGATGSAGQNATSYWLVASNAAIRKSEAGAYTPSTLTMTAKSQTGTGTPTNYSGRFIIAETTDGTNWTTRYTSATNEATKTHTPTAGIVAIRVQLYLAGGTTTLLDEEIIPIVADGIKGADGANGSDGQTLYTWVKYADTPTTGMSDSPTNKTYIGLAYNKTTPTKSTNYADYAWSLIKGADGVAGARGSDGTTYYTWIKYADDASGSGMSDSPTGKRFLGLAHNKTTATESNTPTDYTWSPLYDNVSVGGRNFYSFVNTTISNLQNAPTVTKNHAEAPNGIRITGQQSLVGSIRLNNVINENGWWTVSFWGKANGASSLTIDVCDLGSKTLNFTTSWQKFEVSVNVTNYSAASFHFIDISNIGWVNYDLKELMIEHASVASGYSPAPEDVDKSIKNVDDKVNDIYSDLKVTPVEKNELKRMWDAIKAEYAQNLALANSLSVSATSYTTAYNTLNGTSPRIETDILANMATTYTFASASDRDTFRTQITTYVTQREALLKAIGDKQYQTASAAKVLTDKWKHSDGVTINGANIRAGTLRADVVVSDFFKGRTFEGGTFNLVNEGVIRAKTSFDSTDVNGNPLVKTVSTFWVDGGLLRRMIVDPYTEGFIGFFDGDVGDYKGFIGNASQGYVGLVTADDNGDDTFTVTGSANLDVGTIRQTNFDGGVTVKNPYDASGTLTFGFHNPTGFPDGVARIRVGGSGQAAINGFRILGVADRLLLGIDNNGIIENESLKTVSLSNQWVQYAGFQQVGYYMDAFGVVHIQGMIRNGITTQGTQLFRLDSKYRPPSTVLTICQAATSQYARVDINADGWVVLNSSGVGSYLSLAGISFKV